MDIKIGGPAQDRRTDIGTNQLLGEREDKDEAFRSNERTNMPSNRKTDRQLVSQSDRQTVRQTVRQIVR